MTKLDFIICNNCKKRLVHPAMLNVTMTYRANVGYARKGTGLGNSIGDHPPKVMGCVEVEISGDFCDGQCLQEFALNEAIKKDPNAAKVDQGLFFRGELGEPPERK